MKFDLPSSHSIKGWLFLITIALLILISYLIFPLLEGLILGLVFAYVGRPIQHLFGQRRRLGSLIATICIAIPLSAIFAVGAIEAVNQIIWLGENQVAVIQAFSQFISRLPIPKFIFAEITGSILNILEIAAAIFASLPFIGFSRTIFLGIINFIISLPVCFFLLVDGKRLVESILELVPPGKKDLYTKCMFRIDSILSGIYLGSIYTAIAGGITSVAIFYLFGVSRPIAMACIVFLAGLVPFLTWLVFIPSAISRYFTIGALDAVALFLAGSILVHLVELVIRPCIVSAKSSLHPLPVLLTFLGGGLVAGIAGFFLAPAMAGVILGIYQVIREEKENIRGAAKERNDEKHVDDISRL